jgi:hypothetical protein
MKKGTFFGFFTVGAVLSAMLLLHGCIEDRCISTSTYNLFEPVYLLPADMRKPVVTEAARGLEQPGKIYYYQDYLLINEINKGIHIIDNRNPSSPQALAFINIPGNVDMAVRNNILYADNYVDLVTLDISTPANPVYLSRTENVFPNAFPFDMLQGAFIVEYRATPTTRTVPCDQANSWWFWENGNLFANRMDAAFSSGNSGGSGGGSLAPNAVGVGGSMARFTIAAEQYLYVVDQQKLRVFNLLQPTAPTMDAVVEIGWGIETIFPYGQNLFIGANNGMYIYSIANPLLPVQRSLFQHARACDPVYVDGNIAYVTLRDGSECQNFINQLDVVDITNLNNPRLIRSYPMHNPHGLSISNGHLYLCENTQGLKVFDISDVNRIGERLRDHKTGFAAFDVITITNNNLGMVIGKDGLYQFDISNPQNLRQLSIIPINR